jgi:hypothetical protein
VNHCLANLNRAGTTNKRVHFATLQDGEKGKKMRSKAAVKYAATKLHEKVISPCHFFLVQVRSKLFFAQSEFFHPGSQIRIKEF